MTAHIDADGRVLLLPEPTGEDLETAQEALGLTEISREEYDRREAEAMQPGNHTDARHAS